MAIRIIWVDKAKQTYVKDGINDFIKRIRRFGKFEIVEIACAGKLNLCFVIFVKMSNIHPLFVFDTFDIFEF